LKPLDTDERDKESGSLFSTYKRVRALRDCSRRLTLLDFALSRGAWVRINPRTPLEEVEFREIADKRHLLRSLISAQMGSLKHFYGASRQGLAHHWPNIAILRIARDFVSSTDSGFSRAAYYAYILERRLSDNLRYDELTLSEPALQLACLLRIYDCFESSLKGGADAQAPVFAQLVETLTSLEGLQGDDFIAALFPFEHFLLQDPAKSYVALSNETKCVYRAAVGSIAELCKCEPSKVAQTAFELARAACGTNEQESFSQRHVGFYLIDDGKERLLKAISGTESSGRSSHIGRTGMSIATYLSLVFVLSFVFVGVASYIYKINLYSLSSSLIALACLLVICSDSANRSLNSLISLTINQRLLPRLDYSSGIPDTSRTLVCIPSLLYSSSNAAHLAVALEHHYTLTLDRNARFALLTDYLDSDSCAASESELRILDECRTEIRRLNEKYSDSEVEPFYLLHRERQFCQTEGKWIGWERKRGKLQLLNKLILEGTNGFEHCEGDLQSLRYIKYVIVADDNIEFTRGAVQQLVELIDHPLNQAVVNEQTNKLHRGYGIFQPYTSVSRSSATGWSFTRPLLGPICDIQHPPKQSRSFYFDLFACCSFFGKGIYDVKIFDRVIDNRFPVECVLSHDTLEAGLLRTGFAGNVTFIEQAPKNLKAYLERQHRWARGDWQNVLIVLSRTRKTRSSVQEFGVLSPFVQYLLFVFARRSLLPIVRTLLLANIILSFQGLVVQRVLLYLALWLVPEIAEILGAAVCIAFMGQLIYHRRILFSWIGTAIKKEFLMSLLAIHQALLMGDAIGRTVQRFCRGKKLLSWRAASYAESRPNAMGSIEVYAVLSTLTSVAILVYLLSTVGTSLLSVLIPFTWCMYPWLYLKVRS
jgi:cyclic beta-1,2-glucan synthetase